MTSMCMCSCSRTNPDKSTDSKIKKTKSIQQPLSSSMFSIFPSCVYSFCKTMHLVLQSVHFQSVWDIVSASISTQVSYRCSPASCQAWGFTAQGPLSELVLNIYLHMRAGGRTCPQLTRSDRALSHAMIHLLEVDVANTGRLQMIRFEISNMQWRKWAVELYLGFQTP